MFFYEGVIWFRHSKDVKGVFAELSALINPEDELCVLEISGGLFQTQDARRTEQMRNFFAGQ
jgi:hypothetical protein